MSNWYTTDTWFSANDASAWTPTVTATVNASPAGTPTALLADVQIKSSSSIKELKQQQTGLKNWPETKQNKKKITENVGTVVPPKTGTVKFHALPSNAATHQGAWDAFIVKEEEDIPDHQISSQRPPHIAPEEFDSEWETSSSTVEKEGLDPRGNFQKPKRNSDIEEELNRQNLYKTELCLSWAETGTCRYGPKCQFAHGKQELRPVLRHPKYKTEVCKTFNSTGQCPYGKRCRFVHQLYELRSPSTALEPELTVLPEEEEMTAEIQRKLNELNLTLLAPDPVFPALQTSAEPTESAPQKKRVSLTFLSKIEKTKIVKICNGTGV